MALVLSGDGTVTGLAVGGLPDGTVDSGTLANASILPADMANGGNKVLQVVNTQTGTLATGTTTTPIDNTIPQITEGTKFMTLAITPTSATSKLKIEAVSLHGNIIANAQITKALFVGTTANALASCTCGNDGTVGRNTSSNTLVHTMTAGVTTELTFRIRIGSSSGTLTFNGHDGDQVYGGVAASSITITEYEV